MPRRVERSGAERSGAEPSRAEERIYTEERGVLGDGDDNDDDVDVVRDHAPARPGSGSGRRIESAPPLPEETAPVRFPFITQVALVMPSSPLPLVVLYTPVRNAATRTVMASVSFPVASLLPSFPDDVRPRERETTAVVVVDCIQCISI